MTKKKRLFGKCPPLIRNRYKNKNKKVLCDEIKGFLAEKREELTKDDIIRIHLMLEFF